MPSRLQVVVAAVLLAAPGTTGAGTLILPGAAHTAGVAGTRWVSDLRLLNPGEDAATLSLAFTPFAGAPPQPAPYALAAGELLALDDVVSAAFGAAGTGYLTVTSDLPLVGGLRTSNLAAGGTFGQFIPAVATVSAEASFTGLRGGGFRTNLGLVNPSQAPTTVTVAIASGRTVELGGATGTQLGGVETWAEFDPAGESGVVTAAAPVVAYASVVDNATGDPTYLAGLEPLTRGVVPGLAHAPGAQGTTWRSDLYLFAPQGAVVTGTLVFHGEVGTAAWPQMQEDMEPGETRVLDDVVARLVPGRDGSGVLWLSADAPVVAVARTYNLTPGGTFGQSTAAVPDSRLVQPGEQGLFLLAARDPDGVGGFRSNLALANPGLTWAVYTVELLDAAGAVAGSRPLTVPPRSAVQQNDVVAWLGREDLADGAIRVSGVLPFTGYLSSVDNSTGDASTVAPVAYVPPRH